MAPRSSALPRPRATRGPPPASVLLPLLALVVLGAGTAPPAALAAPLTWTRVTTTGAPAGRRDGAMALDATKRRLIFFGGRGAGGVYGDTWQLDLASSVWSVVPTAMAPPPRHTFPSGVWLHGNAFVISTGQGPTGASYNDVWAFNMTTDLWTQLPAVGDVPEPRYGAAGGIFPGQDRLVLSHGFQRHHSRYSNTFEYDLLSQRWVQLFAGTNPYNPNRPHARCLAGGAMASASGLVMYGGCMQNGYTGGPCPARDGWVFNTTTKSWKKTPNGPSPRTFMAMSHAPLSLVASGALPPGLVYLYGGSQRDKGTILVERTKDHVFEVLDTKRNKWLRVRAVGDPPTQRTGPAMVADDANGVMYMYGGQRLFQYPSATGTPQQGRRLLNEQEHASGDYDEAGLYVLSGSPYDSTPVDDSTNWWYYMHLHGLFMAMAWGLCLPAGWFIARYLKHRDPLWFKLHVAIQITGVIFLMVGFIMPWLGGTTNPWHAHGIIGIITVFLGLQQPLNAFFRPHHGDRWRVQWEWLHLSAGRIALLLGLVNVSLGLMLAVAPSAVWITWYVLLGAFVLLVLVMEFRSQRRKRTATAGGGPDPAKGMAMKTTDEEPEGDASSVGLMGLTGGSVKRPAAGGTWSGAGTTRSELAVVAA